MGTHEFYEILISEKVRLPKGLLSWCIDLEISDRQIETALSFARDCSPFVRDWVFQYKISTNILPTNEYLNRYRVKETNICDLCETETDTIVHRLYECELVSSLVESILGILQKKCQQPLLNMTEYLLGKPGSKHLALNHIVLELKKSIFYASKSFLQSPNFKDMFFKHIKELIIKEKIISHRKASFDKFEEKWTKFTYIYDFRGPDELMSL